MPASRTIYLACDHAGYEHKEAVRQWLVAEGLTIVDAGATVYDALDDFPDYITVAAKAVSLSPETTAAVIFGGSGQGEAMVANRFKGVRATVYYGGEQSIITLSREHNDANVLSIGARFVTIEDTKKVIWDWLHLPKGVDPKYQRRNLKIDARL
jgi:ribose 5-phosphate isomerase B